MISIIIIWILCGIGTLWFMCDFEKILFDIKHSGWSSVKKQLIGWFVLFLLGPIGFLLVLIALMMPRSK